MRRPCGHTSTEVACSARRARWAERAAGLRGGRAKCFWWGEEEVGGVQRQKASTKDQVSQVLLCSLTVQAVPSQHLRGLHVLNGMAEHHSPHGLTRPRLCEEMLLERRILGAAPARDVQVAPLHAAHAQRLAAVLGHVAQHEHEAHAKEVARVVHDAAELGEARVEVRGALDGRLGQLARLPSSARGDVTRRE